MRLFLRALCATALLCICSLATYAQVPVSLMPVVRQQFFGSNGLPLAGGLVYTYVAGTSTPAPTYLDSTGTGLNTNPVMLDGGGFSSIWIPSPPIDVAVFNSSGTQQYKVLNVTALPAEVSSLTAGFFQSATINPALSGFLRLADPDQICWRNNGNSADICLSKNSSDQLLFGGNPFAYTNVTNVFTALQEFSGFCWNSNTLNYSCLTHSDTVARTYNFPDVSGPVCIGAAAGCTLTNPSINGVALTGSPTGAGQTIVTTSPTTAIWGQGNITDYDNYTGFAVVGLTPPFTNNFTLLPIGAVEDANAQGSFIEGELLINQVTYSGSAPVLIININGNQIGSITLSTSTSYDIRFTVALSSSKAPQAVVNILSSAPAVSASTFTSGIATIDGTAPVLFSYTITTASAVNLNGQFVHTRVRF
jgi:hypothetical protein